MGTKTYVSCTHTNLYGDTKETRIARISMFESIKRRIPKVKHLYKESLLDGAGIALKTYASWCENVKSINDYSETFNEFCKFIQPEVKTQVDLSDETVLKLATELKPDFNPEWVDMEDYSSVKVMTYNRWRTVYDDSSGIHERVPMHDNESLASIPAGVKVKKRDRFLVAVAQTFKDINAFGVDEASAIAQAFTVVKESQVPDKSRGFLPYSRIVQNIGTGSLLLNPGADSIKIFEGYVASTYTVEEKHSVNGPSPNTWRDELIPVELSLYNYCPYDENFIKNNCEGALDDKTPFLVLVYAVTQEYKCDTTFKNAAAIENFYILGNNPSLRVYGSVGGFLQKVEKPIIESDEDEFYPLQFNTLFFGYPPIITKSLDYNHSFYYYDVPFNTDIYYGIKYGIKIQTKEKALEGTWEDPKHTTIEIASHIAPRRYGSWVENEDHWCYKPYKKAYRKSTKYSGNYDKNIEKLKENDGVDQTTSITYVYGIPMNLCQLPFVAKYCVCYGKVMSGAPDNEESFRGTISGASWGWYGNSNPKGAGCNRFNFSTTASSGKWYQNAFVGKQATYVRAVGKIPFLKDVKKGDAGYFYNPGGKYKDFPNCIYWQHGDNYYELFLYERLSLIVGSIKWQTKSHTFYIDKPDPIYKHPEDPKDYSRNYSGVVIPISRQVAKHMSLLDFTDCCQYANNMYASAYKDVETSWWEDSFFQFFFKVVAVVITVVCYVWGGPLGNLSATFFSTLFALGVSVVCAVLINIVLKPVLVEIFGEAWGSLISAAITVVVSYYTFGYFSENPIQWNDPYLYGKITTSSIDGYAGQLQTNYAETMQKLESFQNSMYYKQQELQKTQNKYLNQNNQWLLANVQNGILCEPKDLDTFMGTTLMTDEFVDLHLSLTENPVDLIVNNVPPGLA